VLLQPSPGTVCSEQIIKVKDSTLQSVDTFTYFGSTLSCWVCIEAEIDSCIAKASAAFSRLRTTVWERRGIKVTTKIKVYKAIVLITLLYACETRTVYSRNARRLQHFHTTCLRRVLGIKWQQKIPDREVLERASLPSIHTLLQRSQLHWVGHLHRMPDNRIPKQLFYRELTTGKRADGGQISQGIDWKTWELHAKMRPVWRSVHVSQRRQHTLFRPKRSGPPRMPGQLAPLHQTATTSVFTAVTSSVPRLVPSAISRHIRPNQPRRRSSVAVIACDGRTTLTGCNFS
jgi:hypothetical protein